MKLASFCVPLSSQSDIAGNLSTNGWTKLSNGLIIQWGKVIFDNPLNIQAYITFPIPFPNSVLSASCTTMRNIPGENGYNHVGDVTNKGMTCVFDTIGGYWLAIGY